MNESEATERANGDQQIPGARAAFERERGATARPFPSSRRLVTAAVRSGRRILPMHGLFDVDVSTARSMLAETDPPLSLICGDEPLTARPSGHRHGAGHRCRHVRRRRRLRHRATHPRLTRRGRRRTQQTSSRSGRPRRSAGRARPHRHDRSQRRRRSARHPLRCRSPRAAAHRRGTHITVPARAADTITALSGPGDGGQSRAPGVPISIFRPRQGLARPPEHPLIGQALGGL